MTGKVIKADFFNRPTLEIAEDILGKYLVRKTASEMFRSRITEVEAYAGFEDKASHAHKGLTKRNQVMYGPAGFFYVYLCYGMYWMLNIVTEKKGYPAALLFRGLENITGPGRLTKKLQIDSSFDGRKALKKNGLWFEDPGEKNIKYNITRTSRIGVAYAGKKWAGVPYRFILQKE